MNTSHDSGTTPLSKAYYLLSLLLLCGLPLTLCPFLEDASRTPKLALLAVLGSALAAYLPLRRWPPLTVALGLFYLWRALAGGDISGYAWELRVLFMVLGAVAVTWSYYGLDRERLDRALFAVAGFEVGYGLLQVMGLGPFGYAEQNSMRAMGTLGNPNQAALFLLPVAILALHRRYFKTAAFLLMGTALTEVRAALLTLMLVLLYLAFQEKVMARMALLGLGLMFCTLWIKPDHLERVPQGYQVRLSFYTAAGNLIEEHPLGIGPARFDLAYLPYRLLEPVAVRERSRRARHCHNELLGLGVEAGLPAMGLFVCLHLLAWKRLRGAGSRAALLALLIQTLFIRLGPAAEVLWLYLLTDIEGERPESSPKGRSKWALLLGLAALVWVTPWLGAERASWWGAERNEPAAWTRALERAPSFRRPELLRRLLHSAITRAESPADEQRCWSLLLWARRVAPEDPQVHWARARFLAGRSPALELRSLLEASLLDPWNARIYERVIHLYETLHLQDRSRQWAAEKQRLFVPESPP